MYRVSAADNQGQAVPSSNRVVRDDPGSEDALSHLVLLSVNLEDRDVVLAVDLISRRMFPYTLGLDKSRLEDVYTAPIRMALQTFNVAVSKEHTKNIRNTKANTVICLTMCLRRMVWLFMYLRQNSHM